MKTCPDTSRLIELLDPENQDFEAQTHIQTCAECRADLAVMRRIPAAIEPELQVSEAALKRTRAAIDRLAEARGIATDRRKEPLTRPDNLPVTPRGQWLELLLTGALGCLTAIAVIVAAGAPSGAGLAELIGYSAMVGMLAVAKESRRRNTGFTE